jgi:hypothetical protein
MTVTIFFSIYFNHNLKLTQFSNQANCWIKLDHKLDTKFLKLQKNITDIKIFYIKFYHS